MVVAVREKVKMASLTNSHTLSCIFGDSYKPIMDDVNKFCKIFGLTSLNDFISPEAYTLLLVLILTNFEAVNISIEYLLVELTANKVRKYTVKPYILGNFVL